MQLRIITYRGGLVAKILTPVDRDILWFPGAGWERYAPESYAEKIGSERMLFDRFGFAMANSEDGVYVRRQFACPYWFITLLTAILPSARLVAWRRRARHLRMRPGLCRHCGYDCRATPDRCPECGTPVAAAR
jgi:hypothetical protein